LDEYSQEPIYSRLSYSRARKGYGSTYCGIRVLTPVNPRVWRPYLKKR
jgi:hypothetical protein